MGRCHTHAHIHPLCCMTLRLLIGWGRGDTCYTGCFLGWGRVPAGFIHAALWELNPVSCLYWLDSEWKTEDWMCFGHFENCIAERSQRCQSLCPFKLNCTSSATPGVASRGLGKSPVRPFAVQWGPRRKDLRHRDGIAIAHKPLPGFHDEKNLQNLKTLLMAANPQNPQSFKNA